MSEGVGNLSLTTSRATGLGRVLRVVVLGVLISGAAFGQEPQVRVETFDIADAGRLTLSLLPGWTSELEGETELAPTLELRPGGDRDALLLVTALPANSGNPRSDEEVRAQVSALGRAMLATAAQTELELFRLEGAEAAGYLFHVTDLEPEAEPGDYREARQGAVRVGQLVLSVTVLTHPGDDTSVTEALAVLASARYAVAEAE
jgi:hypothetical protein